VAFAKEENATDLLSDFYCRELLEEVKILSVKSLLELNSEDSSINLPYSPIWFFINSIKLVTSLVAAYEPVFAVLLDGRPLGGP